ncbi:MAG: ABC transporter permease [Bdellovibrio sp.]|nr:ABC transporter permease [Bdellovibrio sp.]
MNLFRSSVPVLAKRFLFSKYSDGFLSFIAWVSVLGVALGVMALTVVTSVINGFENELVRVITGMNGEVLLYSIGEPIREPDSVIQEVRKVLPEAVAITPSFMTELMAGGPKSVAGAVLQGFEPSTMGQVNEIQNRILSGRLPMAPLEVALGSALAEKLGALEGSEIRLIVPFTGDEKSPPKVLKVQVVGLVRMGMYEYDSKYIFMTLDAVQRFLNQPDRVTNFSIRLERGKSAVRAADRLTGHFSYPFRAKDWGKLNRNLFSAIQLEKVVIAIILTAIVIVAAFNVVSTLMMMIHDKTKEVAILKAMGFRPNQSFQLFCLIGLGIGAVGTVFGILSGLGLGYLLEKTRWINLPPDIYYIGFLSMLVRWREIGVIALMALLVAFISTLYPSWKVSRQSPLEGLRYE